MDVEHHEAAVAALALAQHALEDGVELIVDRQGAADQFGRARLAPHLQTPGLVAHPVDGLVARPVQIDLEARAERDQTGRRHRGQAAGERVLLAQAGRGIERQLLGHLGPERVTVVNGRGHDRPVSLGERDDLVTHPAQRSSCRCS